MLIESKLLRKAIDGELWNLYQSGFDPSILKPPYNEAFMRLIKFYQKHNQLPGIKRLQAMCEDIGGVTVAEPGQCPSKASVYWEQLVDGYLEADLANALQLSTMEYNKHIHDPRKMLKIATEHIRKVERRYSSATGKSSSPAELAQPVWNEYLMTESGNMPGIPIHPHFQVLIDAFVKWRFGNITTIVARSSVGKTWLCLIQCLYAATCGFKSLIASMEMLDTEIMRRLAAMAATVNFDRVVKGTLLPEQRPIFEKTLSDAANRVGYWDNIRIMNPEAITDIHSVEAQADLFGASMVLADAFYDFPEGSEDKKGWEKINENLLEVRRISLASKRHWFLTAQFNKTAVGTWSSDDLAVGGTDKFNHISNNTIFLIQRKREKLNKQLIIKIGKGRDAAPQLPWLHHWNFFDMQWAPIAVHVESTNTEKKSKKKGYL